MKNIKIVSFFSTVVLLFLITSGAYADTYNYMDNTQVEAFTGTSAGGWGDCIGYKDIYNTVGANLSGNRFTIFTNWNSGKDGDLSSYLPGGIKTADLFIDDNTNGKVYAIRLDTLTGKGTVFEIASQNDFLNSQQELAGSGLVYGGLYNQASPSLSPVWATGDPSGLPLTDVTWTYGSLTGSNGNNHYVNNQVTVDLTGLNLGSDWSFFWGTGICSNDAFAGNVSVPEPSILLLLGVGLIGVGGLRRKFKG